MKLNLCILSLTVFTLSACSWVEPTIESAEVTLVKSFNVKNCLKLGTTTATVKHKVGIITRTGEAVTDDLITVARNRAAELGGDSIVAQEPPVDGKMSFDVYKCGE